MGYHISEITKGTLGELSKIKEELEEALDADKQHNPIMVLLELSDLIGAIESYLDINHPTISIADMLTMSTATKRAFNMGYRK